MTDSRHELEARSIHARVTVCEAWLSATDDLLDDAVRHGREAD